MKCEICGNGEAKNIVEVEGTRMSLCISCTKMGKLIKKMYSPTVKNQTLKNQTFNNKQLKTPKEEPIELIVKNYAQLIKNAREKRGLKQEDFAKQIREKESTIHAIETGHREPRIELAKKLEKTLGIKLIEQYEEKTMQYAKNQDQTVTAAHLIQIKHRKKQ